MKTLLAVNGALNVGTVVALTAYLNHQPPAGLLIQN